MKRRQIIIAGAVAAGAVCAWLLGAAGGSEPKAVEQTRRSLRREGFKTDLSDFDFSASPELRQRAAALTRGEFSRTSYGSSRYGWSSVGRPDQPDLMTAVAGDAALVVWKQEQLFSYPDSYPSWSGHEHGGDVWPALRAALDENRADLDKACEAALSGPIRFNLEASHGNAMLLPHLAALKSLAQLLATRAMVELRDNHRDTAWTNLMTVTRLVTAYDPEPVEISHLVRWALTTTAYNLTWQALQAEGWGEERLAALQREWESVDFLKRLPETAAFSGASMVATCRAERREPVRLPRIAVSEVIRSPRSAWYTLADSWRRLRYRHHGTYEDERALMLFHRDRGLQLRRAVASTSWMEMRRLPGVTNRVFFASKYPSAMQCLYNQRQLMLASFAYQAGGNSYLGRAAEAEVRRRLMVTAIALERYRSRHGSYPTGLQALGPELLPSPLMDFMDGQPLRYRLSGDGHFVLYSVGLDGVDNGGKLPPAGRGRDWPARGNPMLIPPETDVVWPRPGSKAEVERHHQQEKNAYAELTQRAVWTSADYHWDRTAKRQAKAESILQATPPPMTNDPSCQGRPLSEVLRNGASLGTNHLTLTEMLALNPVRTGGEPEMVTFELPINYDVMTNLGSLELYVDYGGVEDDYSDVGFQAGESECRRATNGNCLLVWNTIYESPGKHAVMAEFTLATPASTNEFVDGPIAPFTVANLCQFTLASAIFTPETGVNFCARLPESNGTFRIQIKSPAGEGLKTITGSTSNAILTAHWDLLDDHGRRCTNDSYDSVFWITLPDSGRSQTLRGP